MGILFDGPAYGQSPRMWDGDPALAERVPALLRYDRRSRELRRAIFDTGVINDACWHILQDLLAAHLVNEDVRVKHLELTTGLPRTTVLRYLDHLEAFAAIRREDDPSDSRGRLIRLTPASRDWLLEYYEQLALAEDAPLRLPRGGSDARLTKATGT